MHEPKPWKACNFSRGLGKHATFPTCKQLCPLLAPANGETRDNVHRDEPRFLYIRRLHDELLIPTIT